MEVDQKKPVEAKIIKQPKIEGPRSVTVGPTQLRKQMEQDQQLRKIVDEFIGNNMKAGKDYGSINVKGVQSKPSLLKPGAEKFCALFKIRPTFRKDPDTLSMLGDQPGIIAYICELVDSRGVVVGEGRGTAKTDPKGGSDFDINKQVKIAEKRAQIDAVLRTGGLSDFFTQDMEDMPKNAESGANAAQQQVRKMEGPATDKQRALIQKKLNEAGVSEEDQKGYLVEQYGVEVPLTKEGASFVIGELLDEAKSNDGSY